MIGPQKYSRAPRPFPTSVSATRSRLGSVRAGNLAPRDWGMANAQPFRAAALVDTVGQWKDGAFSLPVGFAPDSSFR